MNISSVLIRPRKNGVIMDTGAARVAVDVPQPVPNATHFVTHAHADHIGAARSTEVLTSFTSHRILEAVGGYTSSAVPEGESVELADVEVQFITAGHIPGSAQVVVNDGVRVAVTGDFKTESDILERGADVPEDVDVLILETTFGAPRFQFPRRATTYRSIDQWIRANLDANNHVVLYGYAVGKSQELTAFLNSKGIKPVVPEKTHRINELLRLSDVPIGSEGWLDHIAEPSVFVLPPNFSKIVPALELEFGRRIVAKSCSGWARNGFCLSSHADFKQTLGFVEAVDPKLVLTYGGNANGLATALKGMGYDAQPLNRTIIL